MNGNGVHSEANRLAWEAQQHGAKPSLIEVYDRGTLVREYINRENFRLRQLKDQMGYRTLQIEPPSALFVTQVTLSTRGVTDQTEPTTARVHARVVAEWRPEAKLMLKRLKELGVDRTAIARTGGPYHKYAVKRLAKWRKHTNALINQSHRFWQHPSWTENGRQLFINMLETFRVKTISNIEAIEADPLKAIGDKEPTTGTGYEPPINERKPLGELIAKYKTPILEMLERYYAGYKEAIMVWPDKDALWRLGSSLYGGIWGGIRSDAEVVDWVDDDIIYLESTSREVGNTPESPFHNRALNDRTWREGVRQSLSSEMDLQPTDISTYIKLLTTPPVTMCDDGEPGIFSIDFGYTEPTARFEKIAGKWTLTAGKPIVALGADMIDLNGLATETYERRMIMHTKSGEAHTEVHYLATAGNGITWRLKQAGISAQKAEIGDDIHFVIKPEDVPTLLAIMGPWMRTKGFTQTTNFIWGRELIWKDKDHLIAFIVPRAIKTISSPQQRRDLGTMKETEADRVLKVSDEAKEQVDSFLKNHPSMVWFEGDVNEWKSILTSELEESREILAKLGHSEWWLYFIAEQEADED
jgi:hypothetical protein